MVLLLAASLSCGCAKIAQQMGTTEPDKPVSGKGQLLPGSDVRGSGFLGDYSTLHALAGKPGEWEYVKPGVDWRPYQAIMLRPMEVWVNPAADYPVIHIELYRKIESTVVEIVTRPRGKFVIQRKRWIVERTFGWLNRSRRLAKSFERTTQSDAAFVHVAMIHLMVKRLAR